MHFLHLRETHPHAAKKLECGGNDVRQGHKPFHKVFMLAAVRFLTSFLLHGAAVCHRQAYAKASAVEGFYAPAEFEVSWANRATRGTSSADSTHESSGTSYAFMETVPSWMTHGLKKRGLMPLTMSRMVLSFLSGAEEDETQSPRRREPSRLSASVGVSLNRMTYRGSTWASHRMLVALPDLIM